MDTLAPLDWFVLAIYALIVVAIGVYTGRKEKNTDDYFLGGRQMPWWAVMISIYATSLSALTFIGVPGAAYMEDFRYLQFALGDLVGRVIISFLLLTAYYKQRVTTVYQLLGERFGPRSQDAGTLFFLVTRLLASGVRLAGCAIALAVVFQINFNVAIALIAFVALVYTMAGGIKAVIWTDTMQFILFMLAAGIALFTVITALPNGFSDFIQIGNEGNKFKIFHFSFKSSDPDYWLSLSNPKSLLAGSLFGCFSVVAALGTDQDLVQRMLTCKKVGESQRALLVTAILNFPITLLFLSVGSALFIYYQTFPDPQVLNYVQANEADKIFPHFILTVLAPGVRGLLVAGLLAAAMSSLDSALNALASTAYIDIYKRYFRSDCDDKKAVQISRNFVVLFAVILALIAMSFGKTDSILWLGFKVVGYTYGALLGIFMLAVLAPPNKGNDKMNFVAMVSSIFVVIFLTNANLPMGLEQVREYLFIVLLKMFSFGTLSLQEIREFATKPIAWPWSIVIGSCWTFGFAYLFSNDKMEKTI